MILDLQLFAERKEAPTPRRRQRARSQGQVAQSRELTSALALLAFFGALHVLGGSLLLLFVALLRSVLSALGQGGLLLQGDLFARTMAFFALLSLPLVLTGAVVVIGVGLLQTRFLWTLTPLVPDFSRINPLTGVRRLFSLRSLTEMGKGTVKTILAAGVAWLEIRAHLATLLTLPFYSPAAALERIGNLADQLGLAIAALFLLFALYDVWLERRRYEKRLQMTRDEVRQEMREMEVAPEVKRRLRQAQRRVSQRRMMADVAKATVVITNPTHLAVALLYDPEEMDAPRVVGKGEGSVARRMREVAQEHDVEVLERPEVARALYPSVEIGDVIPAEFYQVIAEILAFVFRKKGISF